MKLSKLVELKAKQPTEDSRNTSQQKLASDCKNVDLRVIRKQSPVPHDLYT
jgi:hypothetical protein